MQVCLQVSENYLFAVQITVAGYRPLEAHRERFPLSFAVQRKREISHRRQIIRPQI